MKKSYRLITYLVIVCGTGGVINASIWERTGKQPFFIMMLEGMGVICALLLIVGSFRRFVLKRDFLPPA